MASRLLTFTVWALIAASALFWGFRVLVKPAPLPAQAQTPMRSLAMGGDLLKVLGGADAAEEEDDTPAATRFQLLGVVAPAAGRLDGGLALIAVDDGRPRTVRVGGVIDGDTVLLSVARRSIKIGPTGGPASNELSLPDPSSSGHASANRALGAQPGAMGALRPGMGGVAPMPGALQAPKGGKAADGEDEDE